MIQGYFLYAISSDRQREHFYIYPHKVYSTLSGAKNSSFINTQLSQKYLKEFPDDFTFFIVPIKKAFDRDSKIKYMYLNGEWTTDINEQFADFFYSWRSNR